MVTTRVTELTRFGHRDNGGRRQLLLWFAGLPRYRSIGTRSHCPRTIAVRVTRQSTAIVTAVTRDTAMRPPHIPSGTTSVTRTFRPQSVRDKTATILWRGRRAAENDSRVPGHVHSGPKPIFVTPAHGKFGPERSPWSGRKHLIVVIRFMIMKTSRSIS